MSTTTQQNETARMIQETAHKVLSAHCSAEQLQAAEGTWSEALWRDLDDAGLTCALEPEAGSELGIPAADALTILRIAGAFSTPVPLMENLLANWLIRSTGLPAQAGPLSIAPANLHDRLLLTARDGGWHLGGSATRVPWARYARALVVVARHGEQEHIALVPSAGLHIVHGENLAREPRDDVFFDTALSAAEVRPYAPGHAQLYALGAALRVLQMAGAMDAVLRLTTQYAQERRQFGRPIGKFQAVQQNVAVMAGNAAACRAAANSVAHRFAAGSDLGIAAAKLRANEAAGIVARIAHQVHGAMGFTQEYELHFLTKRLWSWRDEFGSETLWARRLGSAALRNGADHLWAFITADLH